MNGKAWAVAAAIGFAGTAWAAEPDAARVPRAGELKEFVIEGVPRMEIHGDKPSYVPHLDPTRPVETYLARQFDTPASSMKVLVNLPNYLPSKLASDLVATPWHRLVIEPPVLDILIKHPKDIRVSSWRLVITDDHGVIFRIIRGKGRLPDRLTWDGRGNSGDILRVGHPYSYSYFVLDQVQVPTYLPGKSVMVRGFVDAGSRNVILDTHSIFDASKVSDTGQAILREAQDPLRRWGHKTLYVDAFGEEMDLAQRQAEEIGRRLGAALHLGEGGVRASGHLANAGRYVRIEVSAK